MYRIANVTDRSGKIQKPERIGRVIYEPRIETFSDGLKRMYAVYGGEHYGKMIVTSPVIMNTYDPKTKSAVFVTENSIYTLENFEDDLF